MINKDMNYSEASVYWLHLIEHTDPLNEGYIGVSKNPESRMATHIRRASENRHHNINLIEAIRDYGKNAIIKDIIMTGQEVFCYEVENDMRPGPNIGWNIAEGGRMGAGGRFGVPKNKKLLERRKIEKERINKERNDRIANGIPTELDRNYLQKEKEKAIHNKKYQLHMSANEPLTDCALYLRPICPTCNKNFCAVNYIREGVTHYRSRCDECGRKKANLRPRKANWQRSKYKKKVVCDLCGFRAVYPSQLTVFHIDGRLENIELTNLRTICLCCVEVVKRKEVTWRRGDLIVD